LKDNRISFWKLLDAALAPAVFWIFDGDVQPRSIGSYTRISRNAASSDGSRCEKGLMCGNQKILVIKKDDCFWEQGEHGGWSHRSWIMNGKKKGQVVRIISAAHVRVDGEDLIWAIDAALDNLKFIRYS
jgi:hypothetical protein